MEALLRRVLQRVHDATVDGVRELVADCAERRADTVDLDLGHGRLLACDCQPTPASRANDTVAATGRPGCCPHPPFPRAPVRSAAPGQPGAGLRGWWRPAYPTSPPRRGRRFPTPPPR